MQKLRNKLIPLAALGLLAVIGSLMNSWQATAASSGAPVTVENTSANPVPVTGSTTVSGNVGITGQPIAVNVNNSPTVGLAAGSTVGLAAGTTVGVSGTPNVNITNPATAPMFFRNVDDPGRIPYSANSFFIDCQPPLNECTLEFPAVPSAHRLIIQHVSIMVTASGTIASVAVQVGSAPPVPFGVNLSFSSFFSYFAAPMFSNSGAPPNNTTLVLADQPVLGYIDSGMQPGILVNAFLVGSISATLTGYMLDCSVAPCAPIAP